MSIRVCSQEMTILRSIIKPSKAMRTFILIAAATLLNGCGESTSQNQIDALNANGHTTTPSASGDKVQLIIQNPSTITFTQNGTMYISAVLLFNASGDIPITIRPFDSLAYEGSLNGVA